MRTPSEHTAPLPVAYPTLRDAAAILAVAPSTLSRQRDLAYVPAGGRDHRIPAAEVIRLAQHFRRRSLDEVAYELVDYCETHAPAMSAAVDAEVDGAVAAAYASAPAPSVEGFLREARRLLPDHLFSQVAKAALATEGVRQRPEPGLAAAASGVNRKAAARGKPARRRTASTPRARERV